MDLAQLMPWLVAASTILSLGTTIYTLMSAGAKKTASDLAKFKDHQSEQAEKFSDKFDMHDSRIQSLESELPHLPNKDSVTDLKLAIAELKGTVSTLGAEVGGMSRTVHLIDDYLRQEKK